MKKLSYSLIVLCLVLCLFGCDKKSTDALLPTDGTAIAEIQGQTYHYNPEYLFKLTNMVYSYNLQENSAYGALDNKASSICMELMYLDALANSEISVSKEEIAAEKKYRQETMMTEVPSAAEMLQQCISSDNLKDEAAYWEAMDPYIEKYLYLFKATEVYSDDILKGDLESIDNEEEAQEYKEKILKLYEDLQKKYNVVMVK